MRNVLAKQMSLQVPDAQRLLKDACHVAALADQETHRNWQCAAQEQYPVGAENEYRHLRVAGFSDEVSSLPPEELQVGPVWIWHGRADVVRE